MKKFYLEGVWSDSGYHTTSGYCFHKVYRCVSTISLPTCLVLLEDKDMNCNVVKCFGKSNIIGYVKISGVICSSEFSPRKEPMRLWHTEVLATGPRSPEDEAKTTKNRKGNR
jgi:hypothetical protein